MYGTFQNEPKKLNHRHLLIIIIIYILKTQNQQFMMIHNKQF